MAKAGGGVKRREAAFKEQTAGLRGGAKAKANRVFRQNEERIAAKAAKAKATRDRKRAEAEAAAAAAARKPRGRRAKPQRG